MALVLGGDRSGEVGTLAGALRHGPSTGLVYVDLDVDLNPPGGGEGAVGWMGVAHVLDVDGVCDERASVGSRRPLLAPRDVVLFGFHPDDATDFERAEIARGGVHVVAWPAVADAAGEARPLLQTWGSGYERFAVHVDVIDLNDTPLSEGTYDRGVGLTLDQATTALGVWTRDPRFSSLVVADLNPRHGAEDGSTVRRFVEKLPAALA